jgi:hypothetical protein
MPALSTQHTALTLQTQQMKSILLTTRTRTKDAGEYLLVTAEACGVVLDRIAKHEAAAKHRAGF